MLCLRRGTVVEVSDDGLVVVDVAGERRPAWADQGLVGRCEVGDDIVVNVEAVELGLGSGGFDIVHVNITRGLAAPVSEAHVMKLNYTSLQHAVVPVESAARPGIPLGRPVAVLALHGQLAPLAFAFGRAAPGARLGYVQTAGGALPGMHSRAVRELRERGLLAGFITAGPAYGGEGEAITTAGALQHGLEELGWDAAVAGPGPGILGSASVLGHGGLVALDTAHAALALGCPTLVVARMSSADPRSRHQGLSHHTRTVLELLLTPVTVAAPRGHAVPGDRHTWTQRDADVASYRACGLPVRSMGRDDELFLATALVSGAQLADMRGDA